MYDDQNPINTGIINSRLHERDPFHLSFTLQIKEHNNYQFLSIKKIFKNS